MIKFSEKIKLRENDFDFTDHVKLSTYLDLFQSIACEHAEQNGLGFKAMFDKGIIWVITKIKLDVYKNFKVGEIITAESYPHQKGAVEYVRDYYIYDQSGALAVKGSSQWILLDYKSRRILRPSVDFIGEHVSEYAYEKRIEKIPPTDIELIGSYKTGRLDLDHNGHVNNVKYADMIFSYEKDISKPVRSFTINYQTESKEGEVIDIYTDNLGLYTGTKGGVVAFTAKVVREDF